MAGLQQEPRPRYVIELLPVSFPPARLCPLAAQPWPGSIPRAGRSGSWSAIVSKKVLFSFFNPRQKGFPLPPAAQYGLNIPTVWRCQRTPQIKERDAGERGRQVPSERRWPENLPVLGWRAEAGTCWARGKVHSQQYQPNPHLPCGGKPGTAPRAWLAALARPCLCPAPRQAASHQGPFWCHRPVPGFRLSSRRGRLA